MIVEVKGKQHIADKFGIFEIIGGEYYLSKLIIGKVLFYKTNGECVYAGKRTHDAFVGHIVSL